MPLGFESLDTRWTLLLLTTLYFLPLNQIEKSRNSPCGADDLRNMLERSNSRTKAHRTMSYRGGNSEHMKYR